MSCFPIRKLIRRRSSASSDGKESTKEKGSTIAMPPVDGETILLPPIKSEDRYSMLLTGYNKALEFPLESLDIDFSQEIATGVFTVFYKGISSGIPVAVKTLKPEPEILFFKALVRELKIMSSLQEHENIVSLMGACTANIQLRQLYIVVEYCEKGTLENYLRSHRSGFVNKFSSANRQHENESIYENFSGVAQKALSSKDLLRWGLEVARGMDFLASNRLIHWELACRSVFLTQYLRAKLGDFHSLRKLPAGSDYFVLKEACPLPWKFIALESLKKKKFSEKSDVWTYGITLWEIFSMAEDPYVGSSSSVLSEFIERVSNGQRPYSPPYASERLNKLMNSCWLEKPERRPNFQDILTVLNAELNDLSVIPYIEVTQF